MTLWVHFWVCSIYFLRSAILWTVSLFSEKGIAQGIRKGSNLSVCQTQRQCSSVESHNEGSSIKQLSSGVLLPCSSFFSENKTVFNRTLNCFYLMDQVSAPRSLRVCKVLFLSFRRICKDFTFRQVSSQLQNKANS